MDDSTLLLILLLMWNYQITRASQCITRESESNVFLYGFLIESSKVDTLSACTSKCKKNKVCASINMNLMKRKCDLNYSTKKRHPKNMARQPNVIYMEIRDDDAAPGSRPDIPIPSCKKLKEDDSQVKSGVYWMKFNEPPSVPFQVFCDMTTDGGGWTLVYSYTFTQYYNFVYKSNAVTPVPNWPTAWTPSANTPQSTTTPLTESSRSAMDFALWKRIGNELLLKPNISNWVACVKGTGSLVNWVTGSLTCRVVKAITPTCRDIVPTDLKLYAHGAASLFLSGKVYIHLESSTERDWPCHDPCGTTAKNHLTNIPSPGGGGVHSLMQVDKVPSSPISNRQHKWTITFV